MVKEWLAKKLIKHYIGGNTMLKGYVTYISAALMVLTGILQIMGMAPEIIQTSMQGWDLVMAGLAIFGIGRKLATIENK